MSELQSLGLKLVHSGLQTQLLLLDQQALPHQEIWVDATAPADMIAAIQALKVRGAPLIGVAAALCLGLASRKTKGQALVEIGQALRQARPTAVNLMWAIDRLLAYCETPEKIWPEALQIFAEDVQLCQRLGQAGAELIADGDQILTHCNTGGLATAGIGTALGVMRTAWEQGKKIHVWVDETRPLLQGARLTTWELEQLQIPYTLISDNMAAMLMQQGQINKVFLGADRIALNGDFANKIGTYAVAVNAHYHQLPFYAVAPYSTLDPHCPSGAEIPIEQRSAAEVRGVSGPAGSLSWAPAQAAVYNPAFDVTPVALLTALITDRGVFSQAALQAGALKTLV